MFALLKKIISFFRNLDDYERPQAFKEMDRRREESTYSHNVNNIHHTDYNNRFNNGGMNH